MTRCPSCASESLRVLGVQPGRVITPTRSRRSANPLSVKLWCKDCGHIWYHEVERVYLTLGEWADGMEAFVEYMEPV